MKNQDWRKTKVTTFDVIRSFWQGLKPWSGYFYAAIFTLLVAGTAEVIYPIFYKQFFNILTAAVPVPGVAQALLGVVFMVLLVRAIAWAGWRSATFLTMYYQANAMGRIKDQAFEYITRHSQTFFANNFVGSLVQRVNKAARGFETVTDSMSWNFIPVFIKIVGYTVVLFIERPLFAVIVFAWALLFVGFNYFFAVWKMKYDIERSEADSRTTGALADALTNRASIDYFSRHAHENSRFAKVVAAQTKITLFSWKLGGFVEAVQAALIVGVEFSVFYFGIKLWNAGELSVGTFVLVQAYIAALSDSLWDFGKTVRKFYEAFSDGQELSQIMHTGHEIVDAPDAGKLSVSNGDIKFSKVVFGYGNGINVLENFNLQVKPGERVALVGTSGAGKSTIVSLLLRFHDLQNGAIEIDGQNIRHVTQDSLHESIAMVPQDTILFHRTLRENIRYGRLDATDAEVEAAARAAHCDEFIGRLPKHYETYVGERGIKLSGGERQRIAIARAILKAAPILVLDEATSSLDSHSESLIQDALATLMEGRTTLVIAHRLSTIRRMDRIIVLEAGKVVEDGSHDELLANPASRYKKLWDLQAGGFIGAGSAKTEEIEEENEIILDEDGDDDLSPGFSA